MALDGPIEPILDGFDRHVRRRRQCSAHDAGSFGQIFGAAATAGALLRLDARRVRYMLSYTAQQASGMYTMFRDPERHPLAVFHAGFGTLYYAISVMGTALTTYFVPGHTRARHFDTAFGAWEIESDRPGHS